MKNKLALLSFAVGVGISSIAGAQILAQDVVPEPIENRPVLLENKFPSFADVIEGLMPSVVNISTTQKSDFRPEEIMNGVEVLSPEVRDYIQPKTENHVALGSGFIIDTEGHIVTNAHVIDKADKISVILHDNTVLEATIIGKDAKTDVALIKVNTDKRLKPVRMGSSDRIRVGDWVLAIGNPFGLGGSVSAGIVSAKSRDIESGPYDNFIQTDASINQGSSGGPMFNTNGEVIGINTAIFSTNGASMGVGFAIPTNLSNWVIEQLKANGNVTRGWIGIKIQPLTLDVATNLGLEENQGVLVSSVTANAPAQRARIQAGDVILSFDEQSLADTKDFSRMVAETPVGKLVKVEVFRNNETLPLMVRVEELIETSKIPSLPKVAPQIQENKVENGVMYVGELDIRVTRPNADLLEKYQLGEGSRGVIITSVEPTSDAAMKGLKEGDLIVKVDNKDILEFNDITDYIKEAKMENNRPILLLVQTLDVVNFVTVRLKP